MKNKRIISVTAAGCLVIIFSVFTYCWFFFQFWTHKDTASFKSLAEFKGEHTKSHKGRQILVHRTFIPVLENMDENAKRHGVKILVTGSYRIPDQKLSKEVVRPATMSNHLAGHAVDLNVRLKWKLYESADLGKENLGNLPEPVKLFIQEIRDNESTRWGGDFKTQDPVHVDSGLNSKDLNLWKNYHDDCFNDYSKAESKLKTFFSKYFLGNRLF